MYVCVYIDSVWMPKRLFYGSIIFNNEIVNEMKQNTCMTFGLVLICFNCYLSNIMQTVYAHMNKGQPHTLYTQTVNEF